MGVLSNRELVAALDDRRLRIDPRPEPGPESKLSPFNASSVDLRLSADLQLPKRGLSLSFDLRTGRVAETLATICDRHVLTESGFVLEPNRFVLGQTIERVELPLAGRLAARIEGRSSFARTGLLVHFTAPTIHPGFGKPTTGSPIALEICNLGEWDFLLYPDMAICQLIVEVVRGKAAPTANQFARQVNSTGASR